MLLKSYTDSIPHLRKLQTFASNELKFVITDKEAILLAYDSLKPDTIFRLLTEICKQEGVNESLDLFIKSLLYLTGTQAAAMWVLQEGKFELLVLESPHEELIKINQTKISSELAQKLEAEFITHGSTNAKVIMLKGNREEDDFYSLGNHAVLAIPLLHFGQMQGLLTLFGSTPVPFNKHLTHWLKKLVPLVSSLVYEHKLRLNATAREQALSLLLRETEILVKTQSEEELLQEAGEMAMEILSLESGFFLMLNEDGSWRIQAPFGLLKDKEDNWRFRVENFVNNQASKQFLQFRSFSSIQVEKELSDLGHSIFIHPLVSHSGIVGQLWLSSINEKISDQHQEILTAFVRGVGVALETIQQRKQLELLAMTDPLTGILNRQGFEKRIQEEMAATLRRKTSFLLLILDLDGFKNINDTQGHPAGDFALKQIAQMIRKSVREQDIVARTGGDEFTVILTDIKRGSEAHRTIERMRSHMSLSSLGLGVSIGVAEFPSEASNYDQLYRLADQRLYRGKGTGKGKIVMQ